MLSPKIPPKVFSSLFLFFTLYLFHFIFSFFLVNPNKTPTVIHANIWVISRIIPIVWFPNKLIPTVPIINKGPELLVKASILSPSSFVQSPFSLKWHTIFAPTGYPLIIPIKKAYAPSPGTLKIGLINLFRYFPSIGIKLVLFRSSVATKNGKRVGTTEFAHRKRPSFAEVKLVFENNTKHKIKLQKIIIYYL